MEAHEFSLVGGPIPQNSGYAVYAALTTIMPALHGRRGMQVAPIGGTRVKNDPSVINFDQRSRLQIRGISDEEATILQDKALNVLGNFVILKRWTKRTINPRSVMASRIVIYKNRQKDSRRPLDADPTEEQGFMVYLMEQLTKMGADPKTVTMKLGSRRALKFKDCHFLGFSVSLVVPDPTLAEIILKNGLGSFQTMGCGIFRPYLYVR